jgi:hypothetical protein
MGAVAFSAARPLTPFADLGCPISTFFRAMPAKPQSMSGPLHERAPCLIHRSSITRCRRDSALASHAARHGITTEWSGSDGR